MKRSFFILVALAAALPLAAQTPAAPATAPVPTPPAGQRPGDPGLEQFGPAAPHVAKGLRRAWEVQHMISAAVCAAPVRSVAVEAPDLALMGDMLADYANNRGADLERCETFVEASKRIIANETTTKRTAELTSRWFQAAADDLFSHIRAAEQAAAGMKRPPIFSATLAGMLMKAHLARYHSHRIIGAVRYNLFKRSVKLAELVASVSDEKAALDAWRDLVAAAEIYDRARPAGVKGPEVAPLLRKELRIFETAYKELEEQCCPPEEGILKERIWQPFPDSPATPQPPRIK